MAGNPTRIIQTREYILDLIISDSPGSFVSCGTLSPPANCDHYIIYANLNCQKYKPKSFSREIWNFNDVDLDGLNSTLSTVVWNDVFDAALFDILTLFINDVFLYS